MYSFTVVEGNIYCCLLPGPTLLFEKVSKRGEKGRRFYACSACRDRKDCSFFQWEDEKVSKATLLAREAENQSKLLPFKHQEQCKRFQEFTSLPDNKKKFCQDCQILLLPTEHSVHSAHKTTVITTAQLWRPSILLQPLSNKKGNAQYLFTHRSASFLLDTLADLGFNKVLCVGTPRLQELIKLRNMEQKYQQMKTLLLDIDFRFDSRQTSSAILNTFLTEQEEEKVVMVADPPFGGLVKPLAYNFSLISQTWKKLQNPDNNNVDMPMIWIFPYFFESRILECLPSFIMLDYQVDYDNHPLYKHGKTGRRQSPVRLFTNISPKRIVLPEDEGYRFCSVCERYVSSLNRHCAKCNRCPSKDGREWKHCSTCEKCVKPSWKHCPNCGRCALPDHLCGFSQGKDGCFNCSSLQHKHKECPYKLHKGSTVIGKKSRVDSKKNSGRPVFNLKVRRKSRANRSAHTV
ncbi:unnamed protein product [Menidia menidia]|uniref:(Atlantic silverside) hypothetical protein n=1 Tax=Menidia menidia TaxID=238744 RepID=A0A8S4BBG9_9TELE|nr:unnamed protein product [Menidia menidia]